MLADERHAAILGAVIDDDDLVRRIADKRFNYRGQVFFEKIAPR
jgi:hypothetical protein